MTRLLLAVTRDGEKWVESYDGNTVPKHVVRHGTEYTVIMTMSSTYQRRADAWWQSR